MSQVPEIRIRLCIAAAVRDDREFVPYWMIAFRRTRWNFALDRAGESAVQMGKPLVILEPLCRGYRWASGRMHRFVIDGMADDAKRIEGLHDRSVRGVRYFTSVERKADAGKGLLAEFGRHACVIVTDDHAAFFLPRMVAAAAS